MVRSRNNYDVRRKIVDLEKERADNSLDLSCFVNVAAFLSERVEFIEEQNASAGVSVFEKASKA